jgi:uncharacterized protein (DUF924 family)
MVDRIDRILSYWFKDTDDQTVITKDSEIIKFWFMKSEETDAEIKKNFEGDILRARKGKYESWLETPKGRLALIILFDQFPRNIYRDSPKAYENDIKALEYCLLAIKNGFDEKLSLVERQFLYMPLMHSESLKIQEKSLEYFNLLVEESKESHPESTDYFKYSLDYAQKHYDIIKRFGCYPHRNTVLNRRSTSEEIEFLKQPGSSF